MTFDCLLAEKVAKGVPMDRAIREAAREAGMAKEPSIEDVERARKAFREKFPLAYRKVV